MNYQYQSAVQDTLGPVRPHINMNKKNILFILLLFIVGLLVGFIIRLPSPPKQTTLALPTPTPTVKPVPTYFPVYPSIKSVKYSVDSFTNKNFPKTLPEYDFSHIGEASIEQATTLARTFGFTGTPDAYKLSNGAYYRFTTGGKTLTISGAPPTLSYQEGIELPRSPTDTRIEQAKTRAEDILQKSQLFPPGSTFVPTVFYKTAIGPNTKMSTANSATEIDIQYQTQLQGHSVYIDSWGISLNYFIFTPDAKVYSYALTDLSKLVATGSTPPIISLEDAVARLVNNAGAVVAVTSEEDKNQLSPEEYAFDTATIKNVELAYFVTNKGRVIEPVFVFYSSASDKNTGKILSAVSFVSARP